MKPPLLSPVPTTPPCTKVMSDSSGQTQRSPDRARNPAVKNGAGKYDREFLLSFHKTFATVPPDLEKTLLATGLQTPVKSTPANLNPRITITVGANSANEELEQIFPKRNVPKYEEATTCPNAKAQRKDIVGFLQKRTYERLMYLENNVKMQQQHLILREAELEQKSMALHQQKVEFNKQKADFDQKRGRESFEAQKIQMRMQDMALDKQAASDQERTTLDQERSKPYSDIINAQHRLDNEFVGAGSSGFIYITGSLAKISLKDVVKLVKEVSGNTIQIKGVLAQDDSKTIYSFSAEQNDAFWEGKFYVMTELEDPETSDKISLHFRTRGVYIQPH